jgi:transposase
MMYALEARVHGPIYRTIKDLLPAPKVHRLGCHRPRVPDAVCFIGILYRLVTGAAWTTIESILKTAGHEVSDTTLRARRDEWINAGVFDQLEAQSKAGYHRLVGYNVAHVSIDGSDQLAPCGGQDTGRGFKTHGRLGWKWCIAVDDDGVPMATSAAAANRNDYPMMFDVLQQLKDLGLTKIVDTLHADRGFNYAETPGRLANDYDITTFNAPPRNKRDEGAEPLVGLGKHRWIVEATNSWLRAYGQLRRNTDRKTTSRNAALQLAIALFITHRLTDKRTCPIR